MKKTGFLLMTALAVLGVLFGSCGNGNNSTRYTLTVLPNNADWGIATGSGTYADGTRVDVEAAPVSGYYFIKWSDGAVSNPRTLTVSSDMIIYALFSTIRNDWNPYKPTNGNGEVNNNGGKNGDNTDDWVDLGLPSGLLWSTHNVGANSPEDYGDYFVWGETRPKSVYNWSTYKYCNGDDNQPQFTKYCSTSSNGDEGFTDNLTILQSGDDAATANWGSGWRTPTKEEWEELSDNCEWTWTTHNGVNGHCVTGRNGGVLFLPAAGDRWDGELYRAGGIGFYWSSSLDTDYPYNAWRFNFISGSRGMRSANRGSGVSVRPVRSAR